MRTHGWVVLEDDDRVVGYAYGGPHQERTSYCFSCEVSVYVEQDRRRTGLQRAMGFEPVGIYRLIGWKLVCNTMSRGRNSLGVEDPSAEPR